MTPTTALIRELRILGQVDVPQDFLQRVLRRVLETAHPDEADSPVSPCGGIAGRLPLPLPGLRPVRAELPVEVPHA